MSNTPHDPPGVAEWVAEASYQAHVLGRSYAAARGAEVEAATNDPFLGRAYGLRIADDRGPKTSFSGRHNGGGGRLTCPVELDLSNPLSPVYLRDNFDAVRALMAGAEAMAKAGPAATDDRLSLFAVNAPGLASRLAILCGPEFDRIVESAVDLQTLASGVHVLGVAWRPDTGDTPLGLRGQLRLLLNRCVCVCVWRAMSQRTRPCAVSRNHLMDVCGHPACLHSPPPFFQINTRIGATPSIYGLLRLDCAASGSAHDSGGDGERDDQRQSPGEASTTSWDALAVACAALVTPSPGDDDGDGDGDGDGDRNDDPTSLMRVVAGRLAGGLADCLVDRPGGSTHVPHELVAHLARVCGLMASLSGGAHHFDICLRLFELVGDDVFTLTALARPYAPDAARLGLAASLVERYPVLGPFLADDASVFFFSSGMDAISAAIASGISASRQAASDDETRSCCAVLRLMPDGDYLETAYLVNDNANRATLSTPGWLPRVRTHNMAGLRIVV